MGAAGRDGTAMIDTTKQPDPNSQPYIEPVIAPPPPQAKPPTLPTLIVDQQRETNERMKLLGYDLLDIWGKLARVERVQDILLWAMCLVLLVIIVEAAMLGALLGRMVR